MVINVGNGRPGNAVGASATGWNLFVQHVTQRLGADLGVPAETKFAPELYKLLLYQEGDHFSPHRDTEKSYGMFATLTIMLPSLYQVHCILALRLPSKFCHPQLTRHVCQHQGGELVVYHGSEHKVDFRPANGYSVCCAAFYAGKQLVSLRE